MAEGEYEAIKVSRRIGAPASVIFPILADPGRHRELAKSSHAQLARTSTLNNSPSIWIGRTAGVDAVRRA